MIQPVLSDKAFLQNVQAAKTDTSRFHLWWLGQSGFLIQWQGKHLLLDPYLSDSLTKKYADTDKPHIRMTDHVISPAQLDFIDLVTSSHNHTDHLDADTLNPLRQVNSKLSLVAPEANRAFITERLQCPPDWPLGLTANASVTVSNFKLTGIPAAHNNLETDEQGRHKYMGFVVEFGPWTLYHSGDTLWYDGLADRLKAWAIDLAILPINGNKPERRVAGNLNGVEAAQLAHEIGARWVVPCHYEMFTFNTASTTEFVTEAERLNQPYALLKAGQHWPIAKV